MKKEELIELRELVDIEINKRERIKELLRNDLVREYLEINKIQPVQLASDDFPEIINQVLKTFKITESNGIYVCTSSYYMDCRGSYEASESLARYVPIDSDKADYRIYKDIETGARFQTAKNEKNSFLIKARMNDFERDNIVLNPYNISDNKNGYNDVRMDFFANAIKYNQEKSKQLLLEKYKRL